MVIFLEHGFVQGVRHYFWKQGSYHRMLGVFGLDLGGVS